MIFWNKASVGLRQTNYYSSNLSAGQPDGLRNALFCRQIPGRVEITSASEYGKVQMGAGCPTGSADGTQDGAAFDTLPFAAFDLVHVTKIKSFAITGFDLDQPAKQACMSGTDYGAVGRAYNIGTLSGSDVNPVVKGASFGNRVPAHTESRRDASFDWPHFAG